MKVPYKDLSVILLPAHPASFAIMIGRFSKPPIPVENRFCDHCLSEIEDEFHFLIKCSKYNSLVTIFFQLCR